MIKLAQRKSQSKSKFSFEISENKYKPHFLASNINTFIAAFFSDNDGQFREKRKLSFTATK